MLEGLMQPWHLIVILVIVLIMFGPGKLPELGGALGKSIREFRRGTSDIPEADHRQVTTTKSLPAAAVPSICPACHSENAPDNKFCGKCGERLG